MRTFRYEALRPCELSWSPLCRTDWPRCATTGMAGRGGIGRPGTLRKIKLVSPELSQRARILALSSDLPTLWNAPETTAADRKEIIRLVVDRVVVHVRADSECAEAVIWWRGGSRPDTRSCARFRVGSLGHYDQLISRIVELRKRAGRSRNRGAAQRGRVSHPKIPEGLHEHVGTEALVSLRADPWEDRDQATRSPRVVVAGLGDNSVSVHHYCFPCIKSVSWIHGKTSKTDRR